MMGVMGIFFEELRYSRHRSAGSIAKLVLFSLFEPFGYRQLNSLWRLESFWHWFKKRREWGTHQYQDLARDQTKLKGPEEILTSDPIKKAG
jgi:hypothetical protein